MESGAMAKSERVDVLGLGIDNMSLDEALERIVALIEARSPCFGVTPNVDHTNHHRRHEKYRRLLGEAALVMPDGVPLLWAACLLGGRLKGRVNGTDLFVQMAKRCAQKGFKMFLLGAMPQALGACVSKLAVENPGLRIAGSYSPPVGFTRDENENRKMIEMIRHAAPDILFLGLPGPMGEYWIYDHYRETGVPFSINVGASFDFVGGVTRRAPPFMRKHGLEWLFRLVTQPRKLWKRYLIGNTIFLGRVFAQATRRLMRKVFSRGSEREAANSNHA